MVEVDRVRNVLPNTPHPPLPCYFTFSCRSSTARLFVNARAITLRIAFAESGMPAATNASARSSPTRSRRKRLPGAAGNGASAARAAFPFFLSTISDSMERPDEEQHGRRGPRERRPARHRNAAEQDAGKQEGDHEVHDLGVKRSERHGGGSRGKRDRNKIRLAVVRRSSRFPLTSAC